MQIPNNKGSWLNSVNQLADCCSHAARERTWTVSVHAHTPAVFYLSAHRLHLLKSWNCSTFQRQEELLCFSGLIKKIIYLFFSLRLSFKVKTVWLFSLFWFQRGYSGRNKSLIQVLRHVKCKTCRSMGGGDSCLSVLLQLTEITALVKLQKLISTALGPDSHFNISGLQTELFFGKI